MQAWANPIHIHYGTCVTQVRCGVQSSILEMLLHKYDTGNY